MRRVSVCVTERLLLVRRVQTRLQGINLPTKERKQASALFWLMVFWMFAVIIPGKQVEQLPLPQIISAYWTERKLMRLDIMVAVLSISAGTIWGKVKHQLHWLQSFSRA